MGQTTFARIPDARMRQLLEPPSGPCHMVLDTDTYNEIDDQFAVVYSLLSPNLTVEAIYAAPFHNRRSNGPGDGMERSYEEILRLLERMGRAPDGFVFRGSDRWLTSVDEPVRSEAAEDLIAKARASRDGPLYVATIGAPTNVASALLLAPDIIDRIVVVWLGGNPPYLPINNEFNLRQNIVASQIMFSSGVPLVHIPCRSVAQLLQTTLPEMATYVKGRGSIGDYLHQIYEGYSDDHYARSKVIWDISTIAYLNDASWLLSYLAPVRELNDDKSYAPAKPNAHLTRLVYSITRDGVFRDLFKKLEAFAGKS